MPGVSVPQGPPATAHDRVKFCTYWKDADAWPGRLGILVGRPRVMRSGVVIPVDTLPKCV
jgi:hypothetical protein